jgi:hypothetical protein
VYGSLSSNGCFSASTVLAVSKYSITECEHSTNVIRKYHCARESEGIKGKPSIKVNKGIIKGVLYQPHFLTFIFETQWKEGCLP